MPRYVYRCDSCDNHFQVRHGMKEVQESCQLCLESGSLTKVPQMPSIKKESNSKQNTVGTMTKEFIEQNKNLLSEMKADARRQTYDD